MRHLLIILFLSFNVLVYGQCICERYEKGIEFIKQNFVDKGLEKYYSDILKPEAYGISVYESFFPIYKSDIYYNWINIEKTKAIEKNSCLSKINRKYWKKNWKHESYYKNKTVFSKGKFKGPSHIAVFTEIRDDSLRVDVISNSSEGLRNCGSINKYLIIFDNKNNIKETKSWMAHYECL